MSVTIPTSGKKYGTTIVVKCQRKIRFFFQESLTDSNENESANDNHSHQNHLKRTRIARSLVLDEGSLEKETNRSHDNGESCKQMQNQHSIDGNNAPL